ncbi:MAG: class I SAM-dependent methyltransferase [Patescibacteria group bacterium]
MSDNLIEIIEHENARWSKIFKVELEKNESKFFSSYWWEEYYLELTKFVNELLAKNGFGSVLEAGSGSGKGTLLLNQIFKKTLLDISTVALDYAKYLKDKFKVINVEFVEGNIFTLPFADGLYNFVWNIGVIEHYKLSEIKSIIKEMVRVSSKPGIVAVAMPNFYSGPIMKAWLLKFFNFIPGYKLDTEHFYKITQIQNIFRQISNEAGRKIVSIDVRYFGNPLIMETPEILLRTVGRIISKFFKRNKFLILIICKFE